MSKIDEYLKDLSKKNTKEPGWKQLSEKADGHYFISAYEKGDNYSTVQFLVSDLRDVVKSVENNSCDWQDCIYNYAIVWKIQSSSWTSGDKTEVIGVYRCEDSDDLTEEQGWIDFEVRESGEDSHKKFALIFDGIELEINDRTGPHLTVEYKKNRILKGFYC